MANGGHGGIVFHPTNGTLTKPTNHVEVSFYNAICGGGGVATGGGAPFPVAANYLNLQPFLPAYYGSGPGPTVTIENIGHGFADPRLMDVKIGPATVSKRELEASGKGGGAAWIKKRKMQVTDRFLQSGRRWFRIINYTGGPGRLLTAWADPQATINEFFPNPYYKALARWHLNALITAASAQPQLFFIAASVLFCFDGTPGAGGGVRMRLIDFCHSYVADPGGVNVAKFHHSFILGLHSLMNVC